MYNFRLTACSDFRDVTQLLKTNSRVFRPRLKPKHTSFYHLRVHYRHFDLITGCFIDKIRPLETNQRATASSQFTSKTQIQFLCTENKIICYFFKECQGGIFLKILNFDRKISIKVQNLWILAKKMRCFLKF